jgi:nucleoside-diphosphate-sugar epimerase
LPLLTARGCRVHGLSRPGGPAIPRDADIVVHEADLTDLDAITDWIRSVRPDLVVHLAGIAFVGHSNANEMYESNLIGSRNLL